jgi:ribosomal-protein-serine acetyltransferase
MCVTTIDNVLFPEPRPLRWLEQLPHPVSGREAERPALAAAPVAERLVQVRPFHQDDALPMYQAALESAEQLRTWMTWCGPDFSLAHAEAFVAQSGRAWARGEQFSFAIIDGRDHRFLGSVGLNHLDSTHRFANVGYWVRNGVAGRGVATGAVQQVVAFGLGELGLNRLEFLIPTINFASQRVAQKVGAKFEGVLRSRLMIAGRSHDAAMYALARNDQ